MAHIVRRDLHRVPQWLLSRLERRFGLVPSDCAAHAVITLAIELSPACPESWCPEWGLTVLPDGREGLVLDAVFDRRCPDLENFHTLAEKLGCLVYSIDHTKHRLGRIMWES